MNNALKTYLIHRLEQNKCQQHGGIYSICSAYPYVLEAGMLQANADHAPVCIEATSNQVNQFGGYTGMQSLDFVAYVQRIAKSIGFSTDRIILGGNHLGPNGWQHLDVGTAMAQVQTLVRDYVRAGFLKIHLDASMRCADDAGDAHTPLDEELVAERTAGLGAAAEQAWREQDDFSAPVYVIGTEVPIPGGAKEEEDELHVTTVEDAQRAIETVKCAFVKKGLESAWERVITLVVQPGVEFGDETVIEYSHAKARALSRFIERIDHLVYEAHSTDYQTTHALTQLVRDHLCILKVGPAMTFAFREAVIALADIEKELVKPSAEARLSNIENVLNAEIQQEPKFWETYYHGDEQSKYIARKYSYSDRSRYYWVRSAVQQALRQLLANLSTHEIPLSLVSQFLPAQYQKIRQIELATTPHAMIISHIREVLQVYAVACGFETLV